MFYKSHQSKVNISKISTPNSVFILINTLMFMSYFNDILFGIVYVCRKFSWDMFLNTNTNSIIVNLFAFSLKLTVTNFLLLVFEIIIG